MFQWCSGSQVKCDEEEDEILCFITETQILHFKYKYIKKTWNSNCEISPLAYSYEYMLKKEINNFYYYWSKWVI